MSDRLVIGIDARAAAEVPAGRGRYVRELLCALARRDDEVEYRLYARREWPERGADAPPLDSRFSWRLIDAPDPLWHLRAALAANRDCSVFLSTNSYLTAWFTRIPCAVVVYDLITFKPEARPQRRASLIERATARPAIARADSLICISEWTREDLVARFPKAAAKAVAIPLAAAPQPQVDAQAAVARLGLDRPYVLAVGTLEPRKNLGRLIEAWSKLPAATRESHTLALVGPTGWEMDEVLAPVKAARDDVRLVGFVSDDDLAALYECCSVFCYPSLYEGFGLPVLEAMQAGAPVICSNTSSLPEVGGDAVAYVNPLDSMEIAGVIERVLGDPEERRRLSTAGRERAQRFNWDVTAGQTYENLVGLA
jgi:glycosyltransferase involved in cell wall biosynthesis